MSVTLSNLAPRLLDWERDRLTAVEVCVDEALSMLDRHKANPESHEYITLAGLSRRLDVALTLAEDPEARLERLTRIRDRLDSVLPAPRPKGSA